MSLHPIRELLIQRSALLTRIRQFFDQRGFVEVQTPILSQDIVVDRYLEPLSIDGSQLAIPGTANTTYWLQTSPEFCMKRLLVEGGTAIYQICPAFRAGEAGPRHNPEFTMLEWYRIGDDLKAGMRLLADFAKEVLDVNDCCFTSYQQAFERHVGLEPLRSTIECFRNRADELGLQTACVQDCSDLDVWRNFFLSQMVEPHLGSNGPEIVFDWPETQAALARIRPGDPPVAERFELYVRGVELANGYHELLDPHELLHRNRQVNKLRMVDGKAPLPEESRLLQAMRKGLPPCCGVAVGFDRLVMILSGSRSIANVMPFPIHVA